MSSRIVALKTLVAQHKSREPFDRIFGQILDKHPLSTQDRQLAMAMALGVIRRRNELDHVIKAFASTPIKKMRIEVLTGLRIGVMQLLFMDRIPPSAAVNETIIGLGKQPSWIKGFMNGVLREISRNTSKAHNILTTMSKQQKTNHPGWLVDQYIKQFGKETAHDICKANNELPKLTLRINPKLCSVDTFIAELKQQNIEYTPGLFSDQALIISSSILVEDLPGFSKGWFHVQDEAAQLVALFFADVANGVFLDGCAGLGGKTILLDQILPDQATIHAVEPHRERQALFHKNIKRSRCRAIQLYSDTLEKYTTQDPPQYDGILIDSPCSGLGVIRRHPDIRWNRSMQNLNTLSQTQKSLLHQAAPLVKPGGFLVYVTCSTSLIENEQVIDTFLKRHNEFHLDTPQSKQTLRPFFSTGHLQTLPHHGLDGFFATRLRKDMNPDTSSPT